MSENIRYFRLGLFVLVGLGLVIAGVLLLGGSQWFTQELPAETYLDESVQGLDVGSPVKYRGVQVGKVKSISFVVSDYDLAPADRDKYAGYVLIRMDLDPGKLPAAMHEQPQEVIERRAQAGLRVRMASMSLAGPAYLEVDYVDPSRSPTMKIAWQPRTLYLPSAPSTSTQVVSAIERLASQLERVQVDKLVQDLNRLVNDVDTAVQQAQIPKVTQEVTALVSELRTTNKQVQTVLGDPGLQKAVGQSAALVASAREASEQLNRLLSDPKLNQIMQGLADAAKQAGPAASDMRQTAQALQRTLVAAARDMERITTSLRNVAANLESVSQEARDNPSRLFFGEPPPKSNPGGRK